MIEQFKEIVCRDPEGATAILIALICGVLLIVMTIIDGISIYKKTGSLYEAIVQDMGVFMVVWIFTFLISVTVSADCIALVNKP